MKENTRAEQAVLLLESLVAELLLLDGPIPISEELWDQVADWTAGEEHLSS